MSLNYYTTSFVLETNIYFNITVAKSCVAQRGKNWKNTI
jgi:hypothetical protein